VAFAVASTAPLVSISARVDPPSVAITLAASPPAVLIGYTATPPAAEVVLAAIAPSVFIGAINVAVTVGETFTTEILVPGTLSFTSSSSSTPEFSYSNPML
jgi:hypothetical protein